MKERSSARREGGLPTPVRAVIIGCISGAAACAVFTALFSLFLLKVDAADSVAAGLAAAVAGLSAFTAGFFSARVMHKNGLFIGLAGGAALFVLIGIIGAFSGAEFSSRTVLRLCIMSVCGILGGIIGVNIRKKLK